MRAACIDIGSNTTRLLVADLAAGGLVQVHQERSFTRIGREVARAGEIGAAKRAEVLAVVEGQIAAARELGAAEVRVVATAAVRDAGDGAVLTASIESVTARPVEILSCEREARLAFAGAAGMLPEGDRAVLGVVDVGGGSCELAVGEPPAAVRWWASLALGSGSLTESCLGSDPPTVTQLEAASARVAGALAGLKPPPTPRAVAVGGSATSLARVAGPLLSASSLERALALLTGAPAAAIAGRFEIDPARARLLPAGLLILRAAARLLGVPLEVAAGGIREGVLLEVAAQAPRA